MNSFDLNLNGREKKDPSGADRQKRVWLWVVELEVERGRDEGRGTREWGGEWHDDDGVEETRRDERREEEGGRNGGGA